MRSKSTVEKADTLYDSIFKLDFLADSDRAVRFFYKI